MPRLKWKYKNGKIYRGTKLVDFDKICEVINNLEDLTNNMLINGINHMEQVGITLEIICLKDDLDSIRSSAHNMYLINRSVENNWLRTDVNKFEEEILGEKNNDN